MADTTDFPVANIWNLYGALEPNQITVRNESGQMLYIALKSFEKPNRINFQGAFAGIGVSLVGQQETEIHKQYQLVAPGEETILQIIGSQPKLSVGYKSSDGKIAIIRHDKVFPRNGSWIADDKTLDGALFHVDDITSV